MSSVQQLGIVARDAAFAEQHGHLDHQQGTGQAEAVVVPMLLLVLVLVVVPGQLLTQASAHGQAVAAAVLLPLLLEAVWLMKSEQAEHSNDAIEMVPVEAAVAAAASL
jgi:hypothetical protein